MQNRLNVRTEAGRLRHSKFLWLREKSDLRIPVNFYDARPLDNGTWQVTDDQLETSEICPHRIAVLRFVKSLSERHGPTEIRFLSAGGAVLRTHWFPEAEPVFKPKIIEIRPDPRGGWQCYEAPGVCGWHTGPNGKKDALDYAMHCRIANTAGEIRIFNAAGELEETILFDERSQNGYASVSRFHPS